MEHLSQIYANVRVKYDNDDDVDDDTTGDEDQMIRKMCTGKNGENKRARKNERKWK